jgi:hypothetical protein
VLTVRWLSRLVTGLSPQKPGFRPRSVSGIIGGQSGNGTGFSPSTLFSPRQRGSLKAPFRRHVMSVVYGVVINIFKRVS